MATPLLGHSSLELPTLRLLDRNRLGATGKNSGVTPL